MAWTSEQRISGAPWLNSAFDIVTELDILCHLVGFMNVSVGLTLF